LQQEQAEADEAEDGVLATLKKLEQEKAGGEDNEDEEVDEEADSMLETDSELEESDSDSDATSTKKKARASSPSGSVATTTATNLELSPEFLKQKFPGIFSPPPEPKILITTSLHSTLHKHAEVLESLCTYPRHRD